MNSIEIKNLVKKYGNLTAVDNISFHVKKGEILGFLGPNGAGKTTTIQCITQLSTITSGKIIIEGFDIAEEYLEAKKMIGLSPQDIFFDPYFKIMDVLVYQAGYYGVPAKKAIKRAEKLLKEFELWDKRDKTMRELSGGMKRKLSIIKALMHEPKILILDEPTAALDVNSRLELWENIKSLNKKGITIILTTHYIEEAEKLSNRICIVNKGKIIKMEDTSSIMQELSQNVIKIHLDESKELPKEFNKFKYSYDGTEIRITVSKREQGEVMREAIRLLEEDKIRVRNFSLEEDKLENIFRRLVDES